MVSNEAAFAAVVGIWLVLMIVLYRSLVTIPVCQEGLVYLMGRYRKTLPSGFWLVQPLSHILKVSSKPSAEFHTGTLGVVDVAVDATSFNGRVCVGSTVIAGRSSRFVPAGSRVRLVSMPRAVQVVDREPYTTSLLPR